MSVEDEGEEKVPRKSPGGWQVHPDQDYMKDFFEYAHGQPDGETDQVSTEKPALNIEKEAMTGVEGGYGATRGAGWSGSETSRERAEREDAEGITQRRQRMIHETVKLQGHRGMTCGEVENYFGLGHGAASAALTRLHRAGHVVRLQEKRGRAQIYVLPEYADGRELSPYRPNRVNRHPDEMSYEDILNLLDRADLNVGQPLTTHAVRKLLKEAWK